MRRQILVACALAVAAVTALAAVQFVSAGLGSTSFSAPAPQAPSEPTGLPPRDWAPTTPAIDPDAVARRPGDKLFAEIPPAPREHGPTAAADRLVVRFKSNVGQDARRAALGELGGTEVSQTDQAGAITVSLPPGTNVAHAVSAYELDPRVEFAQPSYRYTTSGGPPGDPAYTAIQHWYYHAINAPAGWQIETGDDSIIVAVVDTGVDITHPDLDGQIWTNPGEIAGNSIDDDGNGCIDDVHGCYFFGGSSSGDPSDDFGHGTFVGGVACGEANNDVSGVGVAFDCTIMPVKVLTFGGGDSPDIAAGIIYAAENGADVINMSLGSGCVPGIPPSDPVIQDAMEVAHDDFGVTIVVAAGNSGQGCVSMPAADPNAIAVSASGYLDNFDGKADFSQYGPEISVTAPGVDIVSAVPPAFCNFLGDCLDDGRTTISSGTSFSTPQVAGLAALLLAQDGTRTNEDVRAIMQDTAHDLPDGDTPNWDGAGRIDVTAALGGDSVFAPVLVDHAFPPALQLTVGVGNPNSPSCEAVILDFPPILASRVAGTFGVSECAASWPPSVATPWFLKGVDNDLFPDDGAISDFALQSDGLFCSAFDTPVTIPDDDPAGAASIIDCPPLPELDVRLSPPASVAVGETFDYELHVRNRGSVSAGPVIVEDTLPPELAVGGPLPAVCSQMGATVTCDAGTLDSGETKIVALPLEAVTAGLLTNCATVDPDNDIAEGVETNNTSCADTDVIFLPPATFSNDDPGGDSFGGLAPDITEVRGSFDADDFYLTVEFQDPISPGDVAGVIDFDTDQNASTGITSAADSNCGPAPNLPPGMTGADAFGELFFPSNLLFIYDVNFGTIGAAPVVYGQRTLTAIIPLDFLSGDDALDFTMVLGTQLQPTDCAPNGTSLSCSAGDCEKLPPPPPPPNDDFDFATEIAEPFSPPARLSENARLATLEPDEPQPCGALRNTVWYSFTPSSETLFLARASGSAFGGVGIAAYTGSTLPALQNIACATDESGFFIDGFFPPQGPQISFTATAGVTYHVQLGGMDSPFEPPAVGDLILTLHGVPAPPCAPGGTPGDNSGFEAGIQSTKLIPCWTGLDQAGSDGGWCIQAGSQLPSGDCDGFASGTFPTPPEGVQAAMTNASGPGSHLLYRCGVLDVGTIVFRLFLANEAITYIPVQSLDYRRSPNQQFRADLVSAAGMSADPFTLRPEHILANLYLTEEDEPSIFGYSLIAGTASAFVGQDVCLRFAVVDSFYARLHAGIDDVRFITRKEVAADTDHDGIANGSDPDDDNDGCTDVREAGADALQGGQRNSHNLWDFFDVPTGASLQRDGAIAAADLAGIVARFGATDFEAGDFDRGIDPFSTPNPPIVPSGSRENYHPAYDRGGSMPAQQAWDLLPANGSITAGDLAAVAAQFGHTCA
ncbi:MAG: S8 family serine peptidase [Dehalococcoidia bacterium]